MENKNTNGWDIKPGNQNININNSPQKTDPKIIISIICGILAILCEIAGFAIAGRPYDQTESVDQFLAISQIASLMLGMPIPLSLAGIMLAAFAKPETPHRKAGLALNITVLAASFLLPFIALFLMMLLWGLAESI